jgi:hypothetical protein
MHERFPAARSQPVTTLTSARRTRPAGAAGHPLLALQRTAGNRAVGRLLQREDRRPSRWLPTSPTLDISAGLMQQAFTTSARQLTERERTIATTVYGQSIDLDRVRVARSSVVATPTTLGDTIRTSRDLDDATLVHELMHIWQYQTSGLEYISCSLAAQAAGTIAHGDRNWAYEYSPPTERSRLADYGPEQQAMLIEDAFRLGRLEDREHGRILAEVRRARPRPGGLGAAIDERAGLGGPRMDPLGPLAPNPRAEELGGTVPQLQWRF